jgi:hypothetical protein
LLLERHDQLQSTMRHDRSHKSGHDVESRVVTCCPVSLRQFRITTLIDRPVIRPPMVITKSGTRRNKRGTRRIATAALWLHCHVASLSVRPASPVADIQRLDVDRPCRANTSTNTLDNDTF